MFVYKLLAVLAIYSLPLLTLTGVTAIGQTNVSVEFVNSYEPLLIPNGQYFRNETGQTVYLLNYEQYKPLYDLWEFAATDSAAFLGNKDHEAYLLFQTYLDQQEEALTELGASTAQSIQLNNTITVEMREGMKQINDVLSNVEKTRLELLRQQQVMQAYWEGENKAKRKRQFWWKFGSYTACIVAGSVAVIALR